MKLLSRLGRRLGTAALIAYVLPASAQGLTRARTILESLQENIEILIPIFAVIVGIVVWGFYMARWMERDAFIRWLIGLVGVASVAQVVAMFLT